MEQKEITVNTNTTAHKLPLLFDASAFDFLILMVH